MFDVDVQWIQHRAWTHRWESEPPLPWCDSERGISRFRPWPESVALVVFETGPQPTLKVFHISHLRLHHNWQSWCMCYVSYVSCCMHELVAISNSPSVSKRQIFREALPSGHGPKILVNLLNRSAGLRLLPILQEILWHLVGSPQRTVNLIIEHLQRAGYCGYEECIDIHWHSVKAALGSLGLSSTRSTRLKPSLAF